MMYTNPACRKMNLNEFTQYLYENPGIEVKLEDGTRVDVKPHHNADGLLVGFKPAFESHTHKVEWYPNGTARFDKYDILDIG